MAQVNAYYFYKKMKKNLTPIRETIIFNIEFEI